MSDPQVWFVTGSSSGFGRSIVEYVLSQGGIAVATLRKPSVLDDLKAKYPASRLLILKLDVTKPDDITNAFEKTKEVFGRIDVVFNNAGYPLVGEIESTTPEVARALFEVTFWGADRVAQEAVKFFREVNKPGVGGRLLNVSSTAGLSAFPGIGYYSASKFALEGLTQALSMELDPAWNIKITLIEPGAFITNALTTSLVSAPIHPAYADSQYGSRPVREMFSKVDAGGGDPDKAVKRFYELARLPDPPLRFLAGKDAVFQIKDQWQRIQSEIEKYESWSEGLEYDKSS